MNYCELKEFLESKMRMSHIYQPVMIMEVQQVLQYGPDVEVVELEELRLQVAEKAQELSERYK